LNTNNSKQIRVSSYELVTAETPIVRIMAVTLISGTIIFITLVIILYQVFSFWQVITLHCYGRKKIVREKEE